MEITSRREKFSGTVTLPDMLSFPQLAAFRKAHRAALAELAGGGDAEYYAALLPGVLAVVLEWKIEGVPEKPTIDTFPTRPMAAVLALLNEITTAIIDLQNEAETVPN